MTLPLGFNSAERLITDAYFDAGKLAEGQDANSEQLARGLERLNDVINFEQTDGLKLWLNYDLPVPLVLGQARYVLSPTGNVVMTKPLRVVGGYFIDSASNRRPITPLSWDEYTRLSNIANQGSINNYFVDKQAAALNVSFWMAPDAQAVLGSAHLIIQQQASNPISLSSDVGIPQEQYMFYRCALANDICTGQPSAIMDRCAQRYTYYKEKMDSWDVEDASTSFTPDPRGGLGGRSFT